MNGRITTLTVARFMVCPRIVRSWSLFLDTAIRVAFVPTECSLDCDPEDEGPSTLWTLPIAVGL